MNAASVSQALKKYGSTRIGGEVDSASPHRLIQMLMEGVLERIARARGCIERNAMYEKGNYIANAVSIIEGLRASLDLANGGDIARNLSSLYDYMGRRLVTATIHNDIGMLDEVSRLMLEIKSGWDAIAQPLENNPG